MMRLVSVVTSSTGWNEYPMILSQSLYYPNYIMDGIIIRPTASNRIRIIIIIINDSICENLITFLKRQKQKVNLMLAQPINGYV